MKKYQLIWTSTKSYDEWLELETDDLSEATREYMKLKDNHDKYHSLQFRDMANEYDYDLITEEDCKLRIRAGYYNMRAICEEARVNYSSWRGWANQNRSLSDEKKKALIRAMDRV